jgi:hypothetical protein
MLNVESFADRCLTKFVLYCLPFFRFVRLVKRQEGFGSLAISPGCQSGATPFQEPFRKGWPLMFGYFSNGLDSIFDGMSLSAPFILDSTDLDYKSMTAIFTKRILPQARYI